MHGQKVRVNWGINKEVYNYLFDLKKRSNVSISRIAEQIILERKNSNPLKVLEAEIKATARRLYSLQQERDNMLKVEKGKDEDSS